MADSNPIIKMLSWKTRLLSDSDIEAILAAIANIKQHPFTLTDITELLPEELVKDRRKRRSISTLLTNLVQIGYLSKPSERKWVKNSASFSHFLSPLIIELGQIEKRPLHREKERKIVDIREKVV